MVPVVGRHVVGLDELERLCRADAHDAPAAGRVDDGVEHRTIKFADRAARAARRVEPHRPDAEALGVAARRAVVGRRIRKGLQKIVGGY